MKLKIMTYNVQHCYNQSLKDIDYDELALEIKNSNADIVGLNEIYGEGSIFGNQVEILAKKSGMNYCAFAAAFEHDYGPYGNGLLSKLPIRFVEKIMIPDPVIKANPEGYYEVIIMDIRMPVMNGLEATAAIRKLERSDAGSIPIIAMTANAYDEDMRQSLEAGMNAHLAKPIDPQVFLDTIRKYIK